jgi:hypothetical protein
MTEEGKPLAHPRSPLLQGEGDKGGEFCPSDTLG